MGHPVVHVLTTLCHLYVTVAISPNDRGAIILFLAIVLIFTTVLSFLGRLGLLGAFPSTGTITAFGTTIVLNILLWTLREVSDIWGPQAFGPAISWTSIGPFLGLLFVEDEVAIMFLWITLFSLFVRLEELEKTDEGRGNARTLFFISLILLLFQHDPSRSRDAPISRRRLLSSGPIDHHYWHLARLGSLILVVLSLYMEIVLSIRSTLLSLHWDWSRLGGGALPAILRFCMGTSVSTGLGLLFLPCHR
jgi:hypothetical protein